jgi:hypothetical protein
VWRCTLAVVAFTCPHCGTNTTLERQAQWSRVTRRMPQNAQAFGAWSCQSCGEPIVGDLVNDPVEGAMPGAGFYYPTSVPNPTYPASVPADFAQDAKDAHKCFAIGAWRASAAMTRRALQGACIDKEAPDVRLVEQIDWLEEQRLITPQMKGVAHKIRLGGNTGAHPDADGLKDVTQDDAERLLEFLEDFVKYVYTIPERLATMDAPSEDPSA